MSAFGYGTLKQSILESLEAHSSVVTRLEILHEDVASLIEHGETLSFEYEVNFHEFQGTPFELAREIGEVYGYITSHLKEEGDE